VAIMSHRVTETCPICVTRSWITFCVCAPTRTEPQKDKSRNEKAPETVKQIESVCSVSVFMSHSITLSTRTML
jgi:hypothetical protein